MEKRQKIFADTKGVIMGMYNQLQHDYDVMTMTLPEDKKDFVKKEVKAVSEKLEGESRKPLMYIAYILFPFNILKHFFLRALYIILSMGFFCSSCHQVRGQSPKNCRFCGKFEGF